MVKWKIKNHKNPYVTVTTEDRFGNVINLDYHSYLFGLVGGIKTKKDNERHSIVLVVGGVGDGKSSFVEGVAGLDSLFNDKKLELEDIAWSMDKFIEKVDSKDNIGRIIWGDEFIQAGGNRGMALTNIGNKLKIGFVTKRLKRNTYYLVVDNIKEFPEKLIEMCDALVVIKSFGFMRGYFDCYTDKININFLYKAFKEFNKNWKSKDVQRIRPDSKGKFHDFRGIFLDSQKFDELKIEQTKQAEESNKNKVTWSIDKVRGYHLWKSGVKQIRISQDYNIPYSTVKSWVIDYRRVDSMESIS